MAVSENKAVAVEGPAWLRLLPGIGISVAVAIAAVAGAPYVAKVLPIPAMVIALLLGVALNPLAARPAFQPGLTFCIRHVLRWAVALLGLRIALGDIVALGASTAVLVIVAMAATVVAGLLLARFFGQPAQYGALAGAGTAVCGASATLATATVLPDYEQKATDTVFVVVAVNAFSTAAMVLYPLFCSALGFDTQTTGVLLGSTIHDVAQVVGAGYAVSEATGNTAVIVKLFRVFLLLPVVLSIGWWFSRKGSETHQAQVPAPIFALMFLLLCLLNSAMPALPAIIPLYATLKGWLVEA